MFKFAHSNLNVLDLERSLKFYRDALDLHEVGGIDGGDDFKIVYLGDSFDSHHKLELTWLAEKTTPYELGDNESHIAFTTKDFAAAHARHEKMGCICYENHDMGIYFIEDPDGYWLEVLPE